MLEMRAACERCKAALPADGEAAWICSYECTFCRDCVAGPLGWRCPNCGGTVHPRPPRRERGVAWAAAEPGSDALVVRPAAIEQLPAFAVLFDAYRVFYRRESDPALAEAFLRERVGRGQSVLLGAWQSGALLGFCQLYPGFSSVSAAPAWLLNDLFVAPEGRRRGVADALMATAEATATAAGAVYLTLQTARDNHAAQALYERRGWFQDREFFNYEWVPE